ncbi:transglycosylase domain-containing protein, partial [Paracoccus benzoatiresistens]
MVRQGRRVAVWSVALLAAGAATTVLVLWVTMRDLPLAEVLPPLPEPAIAVQLATGETLTAQGAYRAPYIALDEMPPHLGQAVLAIEDRRFYEHGGIDLRGTTRAMLRNAQAGGVVQGGSTITQQLVKILYLKPERTLRRKLQEAVLAGMLERQLGKDRILELYLNAVYLGSGSHGMPAAAHTYFDKDVEALSLPEAALLAASIQLPSLVNPVSDLEAARDRAGLVLALMAEQGHIDDATRDQALAELATLAPEPPPTRAGSYFADWVLDEMKTIKGPSSGGLSATATLDPELQAKAERIVRNVMAEQGAAAGATQAALVVMTPDGRVRAMVGGLDYKSSQFNRVTDAKRQPGSTFKLFVYLTALALGADPDTRISDGPIAIGDWKPENFDRRSHGTVTLREAFASSYNLATVRLAQTIGIEQIIEIARCFGIEAPLQATPSLALGTSEVTLLDMTEAFAGVARGRAPVRATGIEALRLTESGDALSVVRVGEDEQTSLSRTQEPMLDLLRAVVEEGTGRAAAIKGLDIL